MLCTWNVLSLGVSSFCAPRITPPVHVENACSPTLTKKKNCLFDRNRIMSVFHCFPSMSSLRIFWTSSGNAQDSNVDKAPDQTPANVWWGTSSYSSSVPKDLSKEACSSGRVPWNQHYTHSGNTSFMHSLSLRVCDTRMFRASRSSLPARYIEIITEVDNGPLEEHVSRLKQVLLHMLLTQVEYLPSYSHPTRHPATCPREKGPMRGEPSRYWHPRCGSAGRSQTLDNICLENACPYAPQHADEFLQFTTDLLQQFFLIDLEKQDPAAPPSEYVSTSQRYNSHAVCIITRTYNVESIGLMCPHQSQCVDRSWPGRVRALHSVPSKDATTVHHMPVKQGGRHASLKTTHWTSAFFGSLASIVRFNQICGVLIQ